MLKRNAHTVFRKARVERGLSQFRIASRLGVGQSTISRLERNLPTTVDASFWKKAVVVLSIDPINVFRECSCLGKDDDGYFCDHCGFILTNNWVEAVA